MASALARRAEAIVGGIWQRAKFWRHAIGLLLPVCAWGCAADGAKPGSGGIGIVFAALGPACLSTWNGTGTLKPEIDHLTLAWSEADRAATDPKKSGTAHISAAEVASNGAWNVGALPVSSQLTLQVYACTVDNRVVWYGKGSDYTIKDQDETTARVFMTPPGKLACAGSNNSGGSLQTARAFSGGRALASGDAIVVGGADTWDGSKRTATASNATDIYDYKLGTWRAGPTLQRPRIWPHVLPLDATHVLVAGGVHVLTAFDIHLPVSLFAPNDVSPTDPSAEILEILPNLSTSAAAKALSTAVIRPFSGAAVAGDSVVFAGGLGADRLPLQSGARIGKLTTIIANSEVVVPEELSLTTARVQPNVLSYADGTVVAWGGQTSGLAADFGEVIGKDTSNGARLSVTGADIVNDPNAQVIGAAAIVLREEGDKLTFFVTGGIPVNAAWATGTPSYIVVVDRGVNPPTAVCSKVLLVDSTTQAPLEPNLQLPGGIGVAATLLDGGYLLVSGGLLSLSSVTKPQDDPALLCHADGECLVSGFMLLQPPADLTGATVKIPVVGVETQAAFGRHFGQVALPLPVGALLTGGMTSLPTSATNSAFDGVGQIVAAPFAAAAGDAACKL
jgi:hypothetical protein